MSRLQEFANEVHDQLIRQMGGLRFDKAFRKDGLVVATYASLIELAGSYLALSERGTWAGAPAVFRAFLDTYVDFVNLNKDPEYFKFLYAKHHFEWKKRLEAAALGNPYLSPIAATPDFAAHLHEHKQRLASLKLEGIEPLKALSRFSRAGMEHEYRAIYSFESSGAHSDLSALFRRHFVLEGDDYELVLYGDHSLDHSHHLYSLVSMLLQATSSLRQRIGAEENQAFDRLNEEFQLIKDSLEAETGG